MKNGVNARAGATLRQNHLARRIHRRVKEPSPDGNRAQRRAYDAMHREAEVTNRTIDVLGDIISTWKQDKRK